MDRKIDSIGTCKVNRKGLPKEGILPKNGKGKQPKGTVRCMKRVDKSIFFTGWQDNKPVHMLSTIKPKLQKIKRKSAILGWKKAEIASHSLIPAYNHGMGGTDRMDQCNSYYHFNHKGIRWPHRIFTHFLGVSVVNAMIIYNLSNPKKKLSSVDFFNEIILALVNLDKKNNFDDLEPLQTVHHSLEPVVRSKRSVPVEGVSLPPALEEEEEVKGLGFVRYRVANLEKKAERLEGIHIPILVSNAKRRKCVFHPKTKTRYECQSCQVPVCLSEVALDSCWHKFHYKDQWGEK